MPARRSSASTTSIHVRRARCRSARVRPARGVPAFAFQGIDLADAAATSLAVCDGDSRASSISRRNPARPPFAYRPRRAYVRNNIDALRARARGLPPRARPRISSMRRRRRSTVPITFCRSRKISTSIPVSLYAATTKKANELMAHATAIFSSLPTTGLQLFTVYGPWGRPDMAPMLFTKAILAGLPIACSTAAGCSAISHTSTTSSRASVRTLARPPADSRRAAAPRRIYNMATARQ